ncbi:2-hydroxyacyl-CoA lyase 2 [Frankliniella fusca]|uniref:2-hydroxyacyl-CoA lyase 2 n=1 Tax=Frankliniella fusca TaxID=407009 RepID=A0AAE1HRW0_9NEOP|nr:2-hydroxyacyl-CoA lyase 2 [Frankliniella fusca]
MTVSVLKSVGTVPSTSPSLDKHYISLIIRLVAGGRGRGYAPDQAEEVLEALQRKQLHVLRVHVVLQLSARGEERRAAGLRRAAQEKLRRRSAAAAIGGGRAIGVGHGGYVVGADGCVRGCGCGCVSGGDGCAGVVAGVGAGVENDVPAMEYARGGSVGAVGPVAVAK